MNKTDCIDKSTCMIQETAVHNRPTGTTYITLYNEQHKTRILIGLEECVIRV